MMKIYESLCCDYAITTQDTTLEKNYRKYSDLSKVFGNVKNPYIGVFADLISDVIFTNLHDNKQILGWQ